MDVKSVVAIAQAIGKARSSGFAEWLRNDQDASYPLDAPVTAVVKSNRLAGLLPEGFDFTTKDGSLTIARLDGCRVLLRANAFARGSRLWNGPDLIPDDDLAAMVASLVHDLVWIHRAEIADALGATERQVLQWGNDVFVLVWRFVDPSLRARVKSRLAFRAVSAGKYVYHPVKRLLGLAGIVSCAAAIVVAAGCASLPDGEVESLDGIDAVERAMQAGGYSGEGD